MTTTLKTLTRREKKNLARQFEDVSWEELERTSLTGSVDELMKLNSLRAQAEEEARLLALQESQAQRLKVQAEQERAEQARIAYLQEAARRKALAYDIEQARLAGQGLGAEQARLMEEQTNQRRRLASAQFRMEREITELEVVRKKRSLRNVLSAALVAACVGGIWATGSLSSLQKNHNLDLASLHQEAQEVEAAARARVAELEAALENSAHLAESEKAQLNEALRIAQAEVDSAQKESDEIDKRRTSAPKQLAQNTAPRVINTSPTATKSTKAQDTVAATNEFGMTANDCDAYDPLCGNL